MFKPENWKQTAPVHQLAAILNAIEGSISNAQEGIALDYKYVFSLFDELQELKKWFPEQSWQEAELNYIDRMK